MNSGPLVGVAIPVYNGAPYLAAALTSVLDQTYPVAEIVVVDDGSDDASVAVASGFGPTVRVVEQQHLGVGVARSRAADLVRGEFIVMFDADDLLPPRSLECRMEAMAADSGLDIVYGHIRSFTDVIDGQPLPIDEPQAAHVAGAMLVRRSAYERVGPFTAGLRVSEGLDWLLRAHEEGLRIATIAEQVQWRRVHGNNSSLIHRGSRQELPRALKASLDRRRARAREA